jgi:hypothetical protein
LTALLAFQRRHMQFHCVSFDISRRHLCPAWNCRPRPFSATCGPPLSTSILAQFCEMRLPGHPFLFAQNRDSRGGALVKLQKVMTNPSQPKHQTGGLVTMCAAWPCRSRSGKALNGSVRGILSYGGVFDKSITKHVGAIQKHLCISKNSMAKGIIPGRTGKCRLDRSTRGAEGDDSLRLELLITQKFISA